MVTKNNKPRLAARFRQIVILALGGLLLLLAVLGGLSSGQLQFGVAYMRCGAHPIITSNIAGHPRYNLPTDTAYQPDMSSGYFCTKDEAEKNGFRHNTASGMTPMETGTVKKQQKAIKQFNPSDVNYTLYVPTGTYTFGEINIMELPDDDPYSYFDVKIDGYKVATIHEGATPSEHELCTDKKYVCAPIGTDKRGAEVQREVSGHKNVVIKYSTTIGDTFIILTGVDKKLTNKDILAIFNSLNTYEDAR